MIRRSSFRGGPGRPFGSTGSITLHSNTSRRKGQAVASFKRKIRIVEGIRLQEPSPTMPHEGNVARILLSARALVVAPERCRFAMHELGSGGPYDAPAGRSQRALEKIGALYLGLEPDARRGQSALYEITRDAFKAT